MTNPFMTAIAKSKRFLFAAAMLAGLTAAPAGATQFFDVHITGSLSGTVSTVQCNAGTGPNCLSTYPGGSTTDAYLRSFNLVLGAMNLVEGNNPFSFGASFGPGLYTGTIVNSGGILTGHDLRYVFADSSCRTGSLGCRNILATSASFSVVEAAVPEPATWAMMLIGFGAMGVSLRRRRPALALRLARAT